MSSGLTVTRIRKRDRLFKSLNLRHFVERGTLLAATTGQKLRTQGPMKLILDRAFLYTSSADTDLRKFARISR
jgi:hypothetical protein